MKRPREALIHRGPLLRTLFSLSLSSSLRRVCSPFPPSFPFSRLPGFVLPFHVRSSSRENAHPPWHRSRNHFYFSLYRGLPLDNVYRVYLEFRRNDGIKIRLVKGILNNLRVSSIICINLIFD